MREERSSSRQVDDSYRDDSACVPEAIRLISRGCPSGAPSQHEKASDSDYARGWRILSAGRVRLFLHPLCAVS